MIFSEKLGIAIKIKGGGYVPKSGLLFVEELQKLTVSGRILDIGTGETGILANCLLAMGASGVVATDIDPEAIQWAQNASNISSAIMWEHCNLYPETARENRFDMIVSNPPQMPMPYQGHSHDYGGPDGRNIVVQIVQESEKLLTRNGKLILLCFDFLGIERAGKQATINEIAKGSMFQTKILAKYKRAIRRGGKTEENIGWIKKIHPWYSFQKDTQGNYFHEVCILEMSRLAHL